MTARLLVLASLSSLVLSSGCGSTKPRSDAGTEAECEATLNGYLPINVVDAQGAPVDAAEVTARNEGSGKTVVGVTDAQGITSAIGANLGSGTVSVTGRKGTVPTDSKQVTFDCHDCGCTYDPAEVTLTLP